jgi:Bacterial Ig-like domain
MKKNLYFLLIFICTACAQFVPPTGGKKDITPPKVLSTEPLTKTRNFSGKTIALNFDEYIDISSIKQELLIIPDPKSTYTVKQKGKNVLLVFDKPFEKNTTYTFNFRNGIKDLNERNPASNLKLVLSTGPILDSLSIKGTIRDIHSKLPLFDATVALYRIDTTPITKRKPDYFIKTDSSGNFSLENLKSNSYHVHAFTDLNNNLTFDQKTERFGFHPDIIDLKSILELPLIEIYRANQMPNKIKKGISREKEYLIQLDKPVRNIILFDSLDYTLPDRNTLSIFNTDKIKKDTTLLSFISIDSLLHIDTLKQKIYFTKPLKASKKGVLTLKSDIRNGQFLTENLIYNITFDYPITTFKEDRFSFKTDTLKQEKPTFAWLNKTHLQISLKTKAKQKTELLFLSSAFTNIKGDTSAIFGLTNSILHKEDLGTLSGTAKGDGQKIVALIEAETNQVYKELITNGPFSFIDILPASYFIKVVSDENKNKIWDPGNINTYKLSEKISISKEPIKIKSNFEIKNITIE